MNHVALVMIARDESRCIERCLTSARAWVDSMIVLDTGSTDDTRERAARAGALVHCIPWQEDFAAARNAALAHADADWSLVLDADEWIVGGARALQELRSLPPAYLGVVTVSNLFGADIANASESPSWIPRILPRGVRYAGRIHEQPESPLPRRRMALCVRHDGYLDAAMRAKQGRNGRLLQRSLAEHPDDAYLHYQYAKDLELCGQYAQALPHYERAFAGASATAVWRHDLVLRLIFTLKKTSRFAQGLALAQAESPRWADSPDYFFALGDLLLDWAAAEPARGAALAPLIESNWLRAVAIGERPELPDSVRGRGSYLAAHNLAVLYAGLQRDAQAECWRTRAAQMRGAPPPPTR